MKQKFQPSLKLVLQHEGGYSNHPKDPGGATNKGVTQRVYTAFGGGDVRDITDSEVASIYKMQYWDAVRADDLPAGVDYAVFDFAINSGVSRAAKYLQNVVGATPDGHVGEVTLAAITAAPPEDIISELCAARLSFMKRLKTWSTFGKGWTRRVAEVKEVALMWSEGHAVDVVTESVNGHADGAESSSAIAKDMLKSPQAITAVGGAVSGAAALANGEGPVQYAVAISLVLSVLAGVYLLVRRAE